MIGGVLLYPVVADTFDWTYMLDGYPLRVYAIDLNQHWTKIRENFLQLVVYRRTAPSKIQSSKCPPDCPPDHAN
jgi:hypothetical protein